MRPVDLNQVRTIPLQIRANKVAQEWFARPASAGQTFTGFLKGLPKILAGDSFRAVVEAVVKARRNGRPVIVGMGGHVIKCGLGPLLVDLMQRGIITAFALNGSAAIHDFEIALIAGTSEDVAAGLKEGTFGMARETGELMNQAINRVLDRPDMGLGALLAEKLQEMEAPHRELSLLSACHRLNVPVTVHVAIGADIIHMHPAANGAALGQATFNDFRLLAAVISEMSGGVYLNLGSAVVMPEVFLKAFTIAQNLGADLHDFVTVNMDMLAHYRPRENVVLRPPTVGGKGYSLIGHHEIMIPLLAQAVVEGLQPGTDRRAKVLPWEQLLEARRQYRAEGKTVVWTNGCFDLLHVGHIRSLQGARDRGDVLVVGLNSDESIRSLKGPERPIVPEAARVEALAALECVDHVVVFGEETPETCLTRLQPDIHCKGADYAPPHGKPVPEAGVVEAYGGRIEYLPLVPSISTTDLIQRIRAGGV